MMTEQRYIKSLENEVRRLAREIRDLRTWLDGVMPTFNFQIEAYKLGRIVHRQRRHNLVTSSGRNLVRDLLGRGVPGTGSGFAPTHIALGTGTTDTTAGSVQLEVETYRDAITARSAKQFQVTWQLFLTLAQGNGNAFTEAGLFDNEATDTGNMLSRVTFSPVNKTESLQLLTTWQMRVNAV